MKIALLVALASLTAPAHAAGLAPEAEANETVAVIEWVMENCDGAAPPMALLAAGMIRADATEQGIKAEKDALHRDVNGRTAEACAYIIGELSGASEQSKENLRNTN